jgi:hypothetical protein
MNQMYDRGLTMDSSSWHKDIRLPPEHYVGCRLYFMTLYKPFADWLLLALW